MPRKGSAADWLGFWSALAIAVGGIVYVAVCGVLAAKGQLAMPLPQSVQLFGGIMTNIVAQLLVVLMACVHDGTPAARRVYSLGTTRSGAGKQVYNRGPAR